MNDDEEITLLLERAKAAFESREWSEAIILLTKIIDSGIMHPDILFMRAQSFHYNSAFEFAISDYTNAIRLNPGQSKYLFGLGHCCYELKLYDSAILYFTEAIHLNPSPPIFFFGRGICYFDIKSYDAAILDYTEAIRLNPKNPDYFNNRGNCYQELKSYDAAILDYKEAIRLNPGDAAYFYNRGFCFYKLKSYDAAILDYKEAIRLNPGDAAYFYNRGFCFYKLKSYEAAIADYTQAILLNPNCHSPFKSRGILYLDNGYEALAHEDFDRSIRIQDSSLSRLGLFVVFLRYKNMLQATLNLNRYFRLYQGSELTDYANQIRELLDSSNLSVPLIYAEVLAHVIPTVTPIRFTPTQPFKYEQSDGDESAPLFDKNDDLYREALMADQVFRFIRDQVAEDAGQPAFKTRLLGLLALVFDHPVRAWDYFDDLIRSENPDASDVYWYCLCSDNFMEPFLGDEPVRAFLDQQEKNTEDWYYSGLIYALAGQKEDAIACFRSAGDHSMARVWLAVLTETNDDSTNKTLVETSKGQLPDTGPFMAIVPAVDSENAADWQTIGFTIAGQPIGSVWQLSEVLKQRLEYKEQLVVLVEKQSKAISDFPLLPGAAIMPLIKEFTIGNPAHLESRLKETSLAKLTGKMMENELRIFTLIQQKGPELEQSIADYFLKYFTEHGTLPSDFLKVHTEDFNIITHYFWMKEQLDTWAITRLMVYMGYRLARENERMTRELIVKLAISFIGFSDSLQTVAGQMKLGTVLCKTVGAVGSLVIDSYVQPKAASLVEKAGEERNKKISYQDFLTLFQLWADGKVTGEETG